MTYQDLIKIGIMPRIDENYNDECFSIEVDNALQRGYDPEKPIVICTDGFIWDGNHRFVAFSNENRINELHFAILTVDEWFEIQEKVTPSEFKKDSFFYPLILKYAKI